MQRWVCRAVAVSLAVRFPSSPTAARPGFPPSVGRKKERATKGAAKINTSSAEARQTRAGMQPEPVSIATPHPCGDGAKAVAPGTPSTGSNQGLG